MRTGWPTAPATRVDHFGRSSCPTPACGRPQRPTAERTLSPARRGTTAETAGLTPAIRELQGGQAKLAGLVLPHPDAEQLARDVVPARELVQACPLAQVLF